MEHRKKVRILRPVETQKRVGLGRSRLEELEKQGLFPRRVKISDRAVGHVEHEVDAWLAARIAARDRAAGS